MGRRAKLAITTAIGLLAVFAALAAMGWQDIRGLLSDDPAAWEGVIQGFESSDRSHPPEPGRILFIGSSSIRFWESLAEDMAPLRTLRRGFGGASVEDLTYYVDRIVTPYAPGAVVVYVGGNDLSKGASPSDVEARLRDLLARIREGNSDPPIYFLSLRPPTRNVDEMRPLIEQTNARIRTLTETKPSLHFIDASAPLRGPDGRFDPELISWDQIHLNARGYAAWAPVIRAELLAGRGADGAPLGR